jgi:hypothetical protein
MAVRPFAQGASKSALEFREKFVCIAYCKVGTI